MHICVKGVASSTLEAAGRTREAPFEPFSVRAVHTFGELSSRCYPQSHNHTYIKFELKSIAAEDQPRMPGYNSA
jgi:hypothetical protein